MLQPSSFVLSSALCSQLCSGKESKPIFKVEHVKSIYSVVLVTAAIDHNLVYRLGGEGIEAKNPVGKHLGIVLVIICTCLHSMKLSS